MLSPNLSPALLLAALCLMPSSAMALPEGVISLPLQRIKNQSAYGLELEVGTPPQRVVSLVDTGSPTYSFESIRETLLFNLPGRGCLLSIQ